MTDASRQQDTLVFVDEKTGLEIHPWPAERDGEAAAILADATGAGTVEAAQAKLSEARAGGPNRVSGGIIDGPLVRAHTLRRHGMASEAGISAVPKPHHRRGSAGIP